MRATALLMAAAAFALAALLMLGPGAAPARAEGDGVINGQIVNGTSGGGVPPTLPVELDTYRDGQPIDSQAGAADEQGRFSFRGLSTGANLRYVVSTVYQNVPYTTDFLAPSGEASTPLHIYETTTDPASTAVTRHLVVLTRGASAQEVAAMEILTFSNSSDRTFLSPMPGGGPAGLLRFALPPGAIDLQPQFGLAGVAAIQIDTGFGARVGLPPGSHELAFTYKFAHPTAAYDFSRPVIYPTQDFRLLLEDALGNAESGALQAGDPLDLGGRHFKVSLAQNLQPGTNLAVRLVGLPGSGFSLTDVGNLQPEALRLLAVGLAVVGIGFVFLYTRRRPAATPGLVEAGTDEQDRLVATLAALDRRFSAGEIAEEEFRTRRDEVKRRLLELIRGAEEARIPSHES